MRQERETTPLRRFGTFATVGMLITGIVFTARAPGTDAAAAQTVGAAFLKAKEAADWKAAAGFLDLDPLERERRNAVDMARQQREMPPLTVERLMRMDPEMPRAAAEYQIKRMTAVRNFPNILEMQFGVGSADSLLALPIEIVAQRWLEVHDERWSYRLAMRMSNCAKAIPDTTDMPHPAYHVLGTVVEDTLAYLLYEERGSYSRPPDVMHWGSPEIIRLIRTRGTWWVLPSEESSGGLVATSDCSMTTPKRPD